MAIPVTTFDLVRTSRFRTVYELRDEREATIASLRIGGGGARVAVVGEIEAEGRGWDLRRAPRQRGLEALGADEAVELRCAGDRIELATLGRPLRWRRRTGGSAYGSLSLAHPVDPCLDAAWATLHPRRQTAPGYAVTVAGALPEPELVLLSAAYDLLRG